MSVANARTKFGTTHALSSEVHKDGTNLHIRISLLDASGRRLETLDRDYAQADLAAGLFVLQSEVVRLTVALLALQDEPRSETLNRAAYGDYLRGLYFARVDYENAAKAVPYFEKVIAAAPDSALGYAGMGEALLGVRNATGDKSLEGRVQAALARAEQLGPDLASVRLIAGRLNLAAGWYERAIVDLQRAAELAPNDSQAFISMGNALYYVNRMKESEAAFRAAFAAQPGYYKPYLDAGLFYWENKDFAKAESDWREAVRLNPTQNRARLNLAVLDLYTGRLAEAEALARQSLGIRRSADSLEVLGEVEERKRNYVQAAALYEEAIRLSPNPYKTWSRLGGTYQRLGRDDDAAQAFRSGLKASQAVRADLAREAEPVAWCAFYEASLGETADTRSLVDQALALVEPQGLKIRARTRLIFVYGLLGDFDSAFGLLQGAKPDFVTEIENSLELRPEMRRDPRFTQLKR